MKSAQQLMKKSIVFIIALFIIAMSLLYALKIDTESDIRSLKRYNLEYEKYLDRTIYGTELATLINKQLMLMKKMILQKMKIITI